MKKHHWHAFWHEKLFEKHCNHTARHALQDVQDMSHHYYAKSKCKLLHRTFKTHKTKITQQKQDKRTTIARHVGLLLQHFFFRFTLWGCRYLSRIPSFRGWWSWPVISAISSWGLFLQVEPVSTTHVFSVSHLWKFEHVGLWWFMESKYLPWVTPDKRETRKSNWSTRETRFIFLAMSRELAQVGSERTPVFQLRSLGENEFIKKTERMAFWACSFFFFYYLFIKMIALVLFNT